MVMLILFSLHASLCSHGVRSNPEVGMRTENRQWIKGEFQNKQTNKLMFCYILSFLLFKYMHMQVLEMICRSWIEINLTYVYVGVFICMYVYIYIISKAAIICTKHSLPGWRSKLWPIPFQDSLQLLPPWEITIATTTNTFFQLVWGRKWDIFLL